MKTLYLSFIVLFCSCGTQIRFVGNNHAPTTAVDVYVEKDAIRKPYTVIGKGYVDHPMGMVNPEKIQKKAVLKAREKGADGIYISDYTLATAEPSATSLSMTDSSRAQISTQLSTRYHSEPMFVIYFIKYSGGK